MFLFAFFYSLAFLAGTFVVWRLFRSQDYEEEKAIDLVVLGTLVGIFVGRFVFVVSANFSVESILHWPNNFSRGVDIWDSLLFFRNGGLSLETGILAFFLFALLYLRRHKWPFFPALDFLSYGMAVARPMLEVSRFVSGFSFYYYFSILIALFTLLVLTLIRQRAYSRARLLVIFLLSTAKPILALTSVIVFYIIEGKEHTAEFWQGFRKGLHEKVRTLGS